MSKGLQEFSFAQNLLFSSEAEKVQRKAKQKRIKLVHLKGPIVDLGLGKRSGRKPAQTPRADIDVLVSRKQFYLLHKLFLLQGYKMQKRKDVPASRYRLPNPPHQEIAYKKRLGQFEITFDVHQEIVGQTRGNFSPLPAKKVKLLTQSFFAKAEPKKIESAVYWLLPPEEQLFYLCLHSFFHHNSRGLKGLKKISLWASAELDEKKFLRRVRKAKMQPYVWFCLDTANRYAGKVPSSLLKSLKPKSSSVFFTRFLIHKNTVESAFNNTLELEKTIKENAVLRFLLDERPFFKKLLLLRPKSVYRLISRQPL